MNQISLEQRLDAIANNYLFLPYDFERLEQLTIKLREYETRLRKLFLNDKTKFSKKPFRVYSTLEGYKAIILYRLLTNKQVHITELAKELNDKLDTFDNTKYMTAISIISDYCETGGKNLIGGTGLKSFDQ